MIISEGIDYIIKSTLIKNAPKGFKLNLLNSLQICSNHLGDNKIYFKNNGNYCNNLNSCKICSNCKYMITQQIESKEKIYIGDGLSDRFGIKNCDFIYAKNKLANFCNEQNIAYKEFHKFKNIYENEKR